MFLGSCYFIFQSTFSPLFRLNNFYGPNSRFPGSLPSPSSGSAAYLPRFSSAYSTTPFPEDTTFSLYFLRVLGLSVHSCSSWLMVAHQSFSKITLTSSAGSSHICHLVLASTDWPFSPTTAVASCLVPGVTGFDFIVWFCSLFCFSSKCGCFGKYVRSCWIICILLGKLGGVGEERHHRAP